MHRTMQINSGPRQAWWPIAIFYASTIVVAVTILLCVAITMLIGDAPIEAYLRNDLLPDPPSLIFVLSWSVGFVVAWTILILEPARIRFDFSSKVVVVVGAVFLSIAAGLYIARVPFLSRTVFSASLLIATTGLLVIFWLQARLFATWYGVFCENKESEWPSHFGIGYHDLSSQTPRVPLAGVLVELRDFDDETKVAKIHNLRSLGVEVITRRDWFEFILGRVLLSEISRDDLERVKPPRLYVRIKRLLDMGLVLILMPLVLPLALLIGFLIKLDSKGPIIFAQTRIGLHGHQFKMFKFRSMTHSTEQIGGRFAEDKDTRITRVGRLLRRYRLDELPQVVNVLRGQMSLIGPRPEQPEIVTRYLESIPYYGFRHVVRPGISGWAQVSYGYAASDEETKTKLEYDFFYIKNMSLWIDTVVFLRTGLTVFTGRGAR